MQVHEDIAQLLLRLHLMATCERRTMRLYRISFLRYVHDENSDKKDRKVHGIFAKLLL
jgi:hypothetical protein